MATFGPIQAYDEAGWSVKNSFVMKHIRRTNRNNLLRLGVLFVLLLVLFIYPFVIKLYLSQSRPAPLSAEEISSLSAGDIGALLPFSVTYENSADYRESVLRKRVCYQSDGHLRFTLTPDEVLPSNIVPVKSSLPVISVGTTNSDVQLDPPSEKAYNEYVLLRYGDQYLLTKRPSGDVSTELTGMLCYLPSDVLAVAAEAAGLPEDAFIPALFDAGGEIFVTLRTDFLFWSILFFIWLAFFIPLIRRIADPTRHEAYRKVYVYAGPTEDNLRDLDRELADPACMRSFGKIITPSWIITSKTFSFEAKMKDRA